MRAITGAVLSCKPCSLAKAARVLALFADSAASILPSSDAATYLRTAADATNDHHVFRRELRRLQEQHQQGGAFDGDVSRSDKKLVKLQRASGQDGESNAHEESSRATEKRKKEKEKHVKEEDAMENAQHNDEKSKAPDNGDLHASQPEGEIDEGSNKKKKKKQIKQEEEAINTNEVEQRTATKEEKRKKNRRVEEEDEEKKGRDDTEGDLGSGKKRKSKRSRGDDNDDDKELVEHTKKKKKQRK